MVASISFRPLQARLRGRLSSKGSDFLGGLLDEAVERVEVSPSVVRDQEGTICLPGEFEKATNFYSGKERDEVRVFGRKACEHGPTAICALRNATIMHGVVYAGSASYIIRRDGPKIVSRGKPEERDIGMLVADSYTDLYFGDWLNMLPGRTLLAKDMGIPAIGVARKPYLHEADYSALLECPVELVAHARFKTLWIIDDRGINGNRRDRTQEMRRRLRSKIGRDAAGPGHVYLARGSMAQSGRSAGNETEVRAALSALGFAIIHPEQETAAALAGKLASARIVVTAEGSAQVHAIYAMPEGGAVIVLVPPDRFSLPGKDMADMAGLLYGFVTGDPAPGGFTIDLDRMRRTIALAEDRIAARTAG